MTPAVESHRRAAIVLALFFFAFYGTLGAFIPYTALYLEHVGFTGTEIGLLLSILPLVKFTLTERWTRLLVRVVHKRTFVLACLLVSGFAPLAFIFVDGFIGAALVMFLFAASRAGIVPTFDHYAVEFAERSGMDYGRLRLFGSIGFIVVAVLTGGFIDRSGPESFPIMFCILGFFAALPALLVDVGDAVRTRSNAPVEPFDANMRRFFTAVIVYLAAYTFFTNYTSLKVSAAGAPQSLTGIMWAAGVSLEVLIMLMGRRLLGRFAARDLIVFSVAMNGLRCVILGLFTAPAMLVAAGILHGFAYGGFHIAVIAYIARHVPARQRLAAQGRYSAFGFGLGIILGSIISGVSYDLVGLSGMFLVGAGLSVAAGATFFRCKRAMHPA